LIDGYKISKEYAGKQMVAVPGSKFNEEGNTICLYKGEEMAIKKHQSLSCRSFPNKYGSGGYTLHYYIWEPVKTNKQMFLLNEL